MPGRCHCGRTWSRRPRRRASWSALQDRGRTFALGALLVGLQESPRSAAASQAGPANEPESAFAIAATPSVQPFSASNSTWEGYSEFLRISAGELGQAQVRTVARLDYSSLTPRDAVLIVHPTHPLDENSLSSFLSSGGRVGIVDDFGRSAGFLSRFGIVARAAPGDPQRRIRGNPHFAIAVPSEQRVAGRGAGRHPIAAGVEEVVTNHPRVFEHPDLTSVLEIQDTSGRAHVLALTGVIEEKGRLFVLGDPSAFINLMIRYPDNRRLAQGVVRYLAPPTDSADAEGRRGILYVVANDFDELGSFGHEDLWTDRLQRSYDDAADALASLGREGIPPALSLSIAAALALWLLATQLDGQLRVPRLLSPTYTRPPPLASQTGLSSRVAVLGSSSANPALALGEMERALRESVAESCQLDLRLQPKEMAKAAHRAGMSHEQSMRLQHTLEELRQAEGRISGLRARALAARDLRRLHEASQTILNELDRMRRAN